MNVYSIKDHKTGEYSLPFFQKTHVNAIRSFANAVRTDNPDNMLRTYPRDFTLEHVGTWDPETGIINGCMAAPIMSAEAALRQANAAVAVDTSTETNETRN